jgi:ATP-dependent RNA helicase RhlE
VHAARVNDAAPGSKGPRRRHRSGGNNGLPQTNRHEANRQEPHRASPQGSGKAEGMQGVAFLHRESRPNTKPNRTQRPR